MKAASVDIVDGHARVSDRIAGFDLVRGLCAMAVAAYHVMSWNQWANLYTWGTYGVYIFFVLSGASMYVAYGERFARGLAVTRFLGLRLARLMPLYLLAMVVTIARDFSREGFDPQSLWAGFLNLFFLFGFGNPGVTSQVVGGWSLGIEFVFYLLFPVALSLASGRHWLLMLVLAFASQHVFIHFTLTNGQHMTANWPAYTEFLSFIFYFAAGCVIGRGVVSGVLRAHWLGAPLLVGSLVLLGSMSGPQMESTLVGLPGLALSLLVTVAVAASGALELGAFGSWAAVQLGRSSYGVYILHPFLVGPATAAATVAGLGAIGTVVFTLAGSMLLALVLERWFEKPIQRYFRRRGR